MSISPFPILILTAALASAALLTGCDRPAPSASRDPANPPGGAPRFHCPMHPAVVSDRPGDCPICNMKLVPIKGGPPGAPPAEAGAAVPGRIAIHVDPAQQHLIGLRTATVERRALTLTLRATGVVEHDETAISRIAPRFGGWIRRLHVNYAGQEIRSGQPLLTVYSPDLVVASRDYLLALRHETAALAAGHAEGVETSRRLREAARRRLELWEIPEDEIRAIEESGQPREEMLLRSPASGHVLAKRAVQGQGFMAGETLFEIGRLDRLWIRALVAEPDLAKVRKGDAARVTVPALGDRTFPSRVAFLYPHVDPQTRRGAVRLELDNPDHLLRPDMWAEVALDADQEPRLTVPASAVIDTGERFIAFVRREDQHLEPRELTLGVQSDDFWQVLGGLQEGEQVVTRALFLIDSESQLKAAIANLAGAGPDAP